MGYKAHIIETCDDDRPHLITPIETTPATTQDEQVLDTIHQALQTKHLLPEEHLLDRGYVDTTTLSESQQVYGVEIIEPVRVNTTWQAQSGQGYDVTCFTIDWDHQTVTCPTDQVSQVWADSKDKAGQPRIYVRFAKADCLACPARPHCTRSAEGPRTWSFKPKAQYELLQGARQRESTVEFKERYAKRAGVEGTISQGTRSFGLRRSRYVGQAKTHLQHILMAVGINLARFVNWINEIPNAWTEMSGGLARLDNNGRAAGVPVWAIFDDLLPPAILLAQADYLRNRAEKSPLWPEEAGRPAVYPRFDWRPDAGNVHYAWRGSSASDFTTRRTRWRTWPGKRSISFSASLAILSR